MKPTFPVSRTASYFPLDMSQSSRQQTGNTHSAGARRAKRRAYPPHLPERRSKAPRRPRFGEPLGGDGPACPGQVPGAAQPGQWCGGGDLAETPREWLLPSRDAPVGSHRSSKELRESENTGCSEKRPAADRHQGNWRDPLPILAPPHPTAPIPDGTRLEPKEMTTRVRGPGSDPNSAGPRDEMLAGLSGSASSATGITPSTLAGLCGDPMSWKM